MKKRALCWLLVLVMVVSLLPFGASAANVNTGVTGLTATNTSGLWKKSGGNITATATSSYSLIGSDTYQSDTLTFTNASGHKALLSFSYSKNGNGSLTIDGSSVTSGSKTLDLERNATYSVAISSGSVSFTHQSNSTTATLSNISLTPYYTVRFYDAASELLQTTEVLSGANVVFGGTTPTKPAEEDGTTYKFVGWGLSLNATETTSTANVTSDMNLYPIFQTVDPGDPIENEGMYMDKDADVQPDGSVKLTMEAYAHGRSGSSLKAKDSEYVLLLDLNKLNNEGLAQFESYRPGSWRAAYFNQNSSEFQNLFYYIQSEDRYARVFIYDCWQTQSQIQSDFATTQDQNDVWYHSNKNSFGNINTYQFTVAYVDGNGKMHLIRDNNYLNVDEAPSNKNEHHYHGVYYTKNTGWGGGSGEFYICYPSITLYKINETKDTSTTRLNALKAAVKSFLQNLRNNPQAKVQIVGYAGKRVYSGGQYVIQKYTNDLTSGLKNVEANYDTLIGIVDNLSLLNDGNSGSPLEHNLYTFPSEALNYVSSNVSWQTDARTVVLFESHVPNYYSTSNGMYEHSLAIDNGANAAISAAKTVKSNKVTIYSIGLFAKGYEKAPLRLNNNGNEATQPAYSDLYTLNHYLQGVSSNFPNATNLASVRNGAASATKYTVFAQSAVELDDAFNYVIEQTETSDSTLNANTILKDFVTGDFDTSNATVKIYTQNKQTGEPPWAARVDVTPETISDEDITNDGTGIKASLKGQTIMVTGYDYASNFVMDNEARGQKLIVEVSGLIPLRSGQKIPTNEANSGLYVPGVTDPKVVFPRPTVDIDMQPHTIVMDFAATAVLATAANGGTTNLTAETSDKFANDNTKVTFSYGKTLSGAATEAVDLTFSGVESALVYGKQVTGTNAKGDLVTAAAPTWAKVNVIPANTIYFDDSIAETPMAFDGSGSGYNAKMPAVGSAATGSEKEVLTFTFTGSGIDVYCTTDGADGWIQATVDNSIKKPYTNTKYSGGGSGLHNIPVISFRDLGKGQHTLVITTLTGANFRLDGIRVYNPMQDAASDVQPTVDAAYAAANEQNAVFMSVRSYLLSSKSFGSLAAADDDTTAFTGAVFIDTKETGASVSDYEKAGPKNEVYLASGQGVAFTISGWAKYKDTNKVVVGLSVPAGGSASVAASGRTGTSKIPVNSETHMYYQITPDAETGNVYIYNTGSGMVSVTDLKITGTTKYTVSRSLTLGAPLAAEDEGGALTVRPMMLMRFVQDFDPEAELETPVVPDDPQTPDTPDTPDDPTPDKPTWDDGAFDPAAILKALFRLLLQGVQGLFSGLGSW